MKILKEVDQRNCPEELNSEKVATRQGNTESRKTLTQKFTFQLGTLNTQNQ